MVDEEMAQLRASLIAETERRGNAVVSVAAEGGVGNYSFTAGAMWKHGVPEAVVIGLPPELGPVLLDAYVDRAAAGERFEPGDLFDDFFDGVAVTFEHVAKRHYLEYFGSAFVLYPDGEFPAKQIIVPTPKGHWPWEPAAPLGFKQWQPILTDSGLPESF